MAKIEINKIRHGNSDYGKKNNDRFFLYIGQQNQKYIYNILISFQYQIYVPVRLIFVKGV